MFGCLFVCLDVCLDVCFFFSTPTQNALDTLAIELCNPKARNSAQACIWMVPWSTLKVDVIGQRSGSRGQKADFHV